MAKNGVDGVYSADPQIDPTATKYDELTFDEILDKNLKVIDATAASLCKDNNIKALVFDMKEAGNIKKAVSGVPIGTIIKLKENDIYEYRFQKKIIKQNVVGIYYRCNRIVISTSRIS